MTPVNDGSKKRLEVLLWSIAFPGFGQLLNKKYFKAFLFIILELMINIYANINTIIMESFLLDTRQAIVDADYGWLMFYPCVYLFAIWDAYRDAGGRDIPYFYISFVSAAYAGTLGVIYSAKFHIGGFYIGPVFLPIAAMITGYLIGSYIRNRIY